MASDKQIEMLDTAVLSLKERDWPMFRYSNDGYNVYKGSAKVVIDKTEHVELIYNLGMNSTVPANDPFFEGKIPKTLPPHMIVKHIKYDFLPEFVETRSIRRY